MFTGFLAFRAQSVSVADPDHLYRRVALCSHTIYRLSAKKRQRAKSDGRFSLTDDQADIARRTEKGQAQCCTS